MNPVVHEHAGLRQAAWYFPERMLRCWLRCSTFHSRGRCNCVAAGCNGVTRKPHASGSNERQVETLRRLRHGGDQHVRVEHVHVNEGGQAVIGNVGTPNRSESANAALEASVGREEM